MAPARCLGICCERPFHWLFIPTVASLRAKWRDLGWLVLYRDPSASLASLALSEAERVVPLGMTMGIAGFWSPEGLAAGRGTCYPTRRRPRLFVVGRLFCCRSGPTGPAR